MSSFILLHRTIRETNFVTYFSMITTTLGSVFLWGLSFGMLTRTTRTRCPSPRHPLHFRRADGWTEFSG